MNRERIVSLVVAIVVGLIGAGIGISVEDGTVQITRSQKAPPPSAELGPLVGADKDNQLQPSEQRQDAKPAPHGDEQVDLHEDARDETPPGVSTEELHAGRTLSRLVAETQLGEKVRPSGAQNYNCPASFVVNQSALAGRRVGVALHFTVSRPGSLLAIRGLFNTPSFGASSNYGIELSGRCQHWVPDHRKAWAQGAANSAYISIEIVTFDLSRAQWLAAPIIRNGTLAALVRDLLRKTGAPLRLVDPVGCVWPAGVTDHERIDCGNTHWDVGKSFPWDVFMQQVRSGIFSPVAVLHKGERQIVSRRCFHYRKRAKAPRGSAAYRQHLRFSRYWKGRAASSKRELDRVHAGGRSWKARNSGLRRRAMARAERFKRADRRVLCR